ncbi:MAG: hypothetical protein QM811_13125 [Pirellulales bacterium]
MAHDGFRSIIVRRRIELELAFPAIQLPTHRPTGKATGDFLNVGQRVIAIGAQGVQFKQFACEVLVHADIGILGDGPVFDVV